MTKSEMLARFLEYNGTPKVSLLTVTKVTLLKTKDNQNNPCACPYVDRITKRVHVNGQFGNYRNRVQNQLDREGKSIAFVPKPRSWGWHAKRADGTFSENVIENKDKKTGELKYYLQLYPESLTADVGFEKVTYFLDGETIVEKSLFSKWVADRGESTQPTDKEVVTRDYSFDSIRELTLNGHFVIEAGRASLQIAEEMIVQARAHDVAQAVVIESDNSQTPQAV